MVFDETIDVERVFDNLPPWTRKLDSVAQGFFDRPPHWAPCAKRKVIHDPVFGTKALDAWLVDILDTYALQRLRQIRQLSLANLTFPSAEHSRFPHSLGVLARVQELCEHMELQEPTKQNACAAALLHDIGHGPFSHLSEDAYRPFGWFDGIVGTQRSFFGPATKPHEALGALLLLTPSARAFFKQLNAKHRTHLDVRTIASYIVGRPAPEKAVPGLLVNGTLDGDKLDYLLRDAYMTGLGIGIDVDRWIQAHTPTGNHRRLDLDENLASRLPEQVAFGKWTLRSAIYHHKKVRAADVSYMHWAMAMAEDTCARLGDISIDSPVDFLRLADSDVLSSHTPAQGADKVGGVPVVEILRRRLARRELPVLVESYSKEELANRGLHRLLGSADDRSSRVRLIQMLRRVCGTVAESAGAATSHDVWLDVPASWTKDPARESVGVDGGPDARGEGELRAAKRADVFERVGDILDNEKYRARLFAHPAIADRVSAHTATLFAELKKELVLAHDSGDPSPVAP